MVALVETPLSAAAGAAISGVFGLAGKVVEAAGNAVRGVGEAVGGALEGALSPTPVTVVNAVGMTGSAGKSNVTGGGTLPPMPKKTAKPAVNVNMPTEKLLVVAVNYLASIESTLASQLSAERSAAQKAATAAKESEIEGQAGSGGAFSNLGEKLGAIKDKAKDRASSAGKLLLGAGLLGALGLGALGQMDDSALKELKTNWSAFMEKFSGVFGFVQSLAKALGTDALAFGAAGSYMFGWRGALVGVIFGKIYERAVGEYNADSNQREGGVGWFRAVLENVPLIGLGLAPVTTLKYTWRGIKAGASMLWSGISNSAVGRAVGGAIGAVTDFVKRQAARFVAFVSETRFFKFLKAMVRQGRMWQLFKSFLQRVAPRLFARLAAFAAAEAAVTAAEATVAATGVGAAPAAIFTIIEKIIAAGFAAWLVYDLYQVFKGFFETPEAKAQDAADEESETTRQSATPVTNAGSLPSAGASPAGSSDSSSNAQAADSLPPAASGPIDAILDKTPDQLTDGELRQLVERQGRIENPSGSLNNPGGLPVSSARSTPYGQYVVGEVGANGNSSVRIASFDTPEHGIQAAMWLWRNGSHYKGRTVRDGLGAWSTGRPGRNPHYENMLGSARSGWTGTNNPTTGSGISGLAGAAWDMAGGAISALAGIAKAGVGEQTFRPTNESLMRGPDGGSLNNSVPPAAAVAAPSDDTRAKQIAADSRQVQTAVDMGNAEKASADNKTVDTPAQASLRRASQDNTLEVINPSWPGNKGDVIDGYLQYYKRAA